MFIEAHRYGRPPETTIFARRAQAHITHHNTLSDAARATLIFMVQDFLAGPDAVEVERQRAGKLVGEFPVFADDKKRCDKPGGYVVETLQAVCPALFTTLTFEDCRLASVNRGGDADTTGAIAGMLAGARYGLAAIPQRWLKALNENTRVDYEKQAIARLAQIDGARTELCSASPDPPAKNEKGQTIDLAFWR